MSATSTLVVNYPTIPDNPALEAEVQNATDYFESLLVKFPEIRSDERVLTWQYLEPPSEEAGFLTTYEEWDRYGKRSMGVNIRVSHLMDPVSRRIAMQDLLREVVHIRSLQISKSMDRLLRELDEGEDGQPN